MADAQKTHEDILRSAKTEFLRCGFVGASLRKIAAEAGVTTGALYRHFRDKEALFEAVVAPVLQGFFALYDGHDAESYRLLEETGMEPMWEGTERSIVMMLQYIYQRFDVFKLLFSCPEQTPYENFTHALVEREIGATVAYMEQAKALGFPVRELDRSALHLLVNAQFTCVLEMILHDVPEEEALAAVRELSRFFVAGWRAFFMS